MSSVFESRNPSRFPFCFVNYVALSRPQRAGWALYGKNTNSSEQKRGSLYFFTPPLYCPATPKFRNAVRKALAGL
ncbi:MAG: hypothetical protein D3925_14810, partial [Candidatus Electrothrix sp. AR5]|nr:hypothetical protein [Candidatus Electrothrix sp. AR5]